MNDAVEAVDDPTGGLVDFSSISGWTVVALAAVALGTWLAARYAKRGVLRLLRGVDGISEELATTSARVVGYLLVLVGAGLALTVLGAQIQPVLAVALVVGAVVVLALRGVADNFGAGVILQTRKPVRHGDWVDVAGVHGLIVEMNARSVVLQTADGRRVHVPNAAVMTTPIINLTVLGGVRHAVELRVPTAGSAARGDRAAQAGRAARPDRAEGAARPDRADVARLVAAAAASARGVLADPAVDVVWTASTPAVVTGRVRYWHDPGADETVASAVLTAVADALAAAGLDASLTSPPPEDVLPVRTVP